MINSWVWKRYVWLPLIIIGFIIGLFSIAGIVGVIFKYNLGPFTFLSDYRFQLFSTIYCCGVLCWKLWYSAALELIFNKIPGPYFFYTLGMGVSIIAGIYNIIVFEEAADMLFILIPLISSLVSAVFFYTLYSFNYYIYAKYNKHIRNKKKIYKVIRDGVEMEIKAKHILKGDLVLIKPGDYIPLSCKFKKVRKNIPFTFLNNNEKVYELSSDDILIRGLKSLYDDILWLEALRDYKDNKDLKPYFMKFNSISSIKHDKFASLTIYAFTALIFIMAISILMIYKYGKNKSWNDSIAAFSFILINGSPIYFIYISLLCKSFAILNSIKIGCFSFKKDPFHNMVWLKRLYINREENLLSKTIKISSYFGNQKNLNIYSEIIKNDYGKFYEIFVDSFDFDFDTSKLNIEYRDKKSINVNGNQYEVLGIEYISDNKLGKFCKKYKSSITHYLPCLIFLRNNEIEFICEFEDNMDEVDIHALEKINKKRIKTIVFSNENQAVIARTLHGIKIESAYANSTPVQYNDIFIKEKNKNINNLGISNDISSMDFYNEYTKYNISGLKTYEYSRDYKKKNNDCYSIDLSISNIYRIISFFTLSARLKYMFLFTTLFFSLFSAFVIVFNPPLTIVTLFLIGIFQFILAIISKFAFRSKQRFSTFVKT